MKLKRMKLVALAMSALMITSALPVTAFAEEEVFFEEVADEALVGESEEEVYFEEDFEEEVVGDSEMVLDVDSIKYEGNGVFSYRKVSVDDSSKYFDDKVNGVLNNDKSKPATCEEDGFLVYKVTIDNYSEDWEVDDKATGKHNWGEPVMERDDGGDVGDCSLESGAGKAIYTCSVCGKTKEEVVTIDPPAHTFGAMKEEVVEDSEDNVIFDKDGNASLELKDKEGSYKVIRYKECSVCHEKVYFDKNGKESSAEVQITITIPAEYRTEDHVEVVAGTVKGVATGDVSKIEAATNLGDDALLDVNGNLLDPNKIEMKDCSKAGSYQVVFIDKYGDPIAYEDKTIPAHHFYGELIYAFANEVDYAQVSAIKDKDGNITGFRNNTCKREISYYKFYECASKGTCELKPLTSKVYYVAQDASHPDPKTVREIPKTKETVTLAPSENHSIDSATKKKVDDLVDAAKKAGKGVDLTELEGIINTTPKNEYVILTGNNICDAGTVKVEYICKICGKTVETAEIATAAREHVPGLPTRKNVVDATCTKDGSYTTEVKCENCGKILEETEHAIKMKPHTNEGQTATNAVLNTALIDILGDVVIGAGEIVGGEYDEVGIADYSAEAKLYTICTECGVHREYLDTPVDVKVEKIVDAHDCVAGTISLSATYKKPDGSTISIAKDLTYYRDVLAFAGRMHHVPGAPDATGKVVCTVCGTVLEKGTGESTDPSEHKHTAAAATYENVKDATCTAQGSYDVVTKCAECGEVMDTVHVVTPATGHDFGAWKTTSRATVFAAGKQTRTCARCKTTETKSLAKLKSIITLDKTNVTVKVGKSATVKVVKWNLKDYIARTAENGVVSANKNVATAFKTGSYLLKIKGKKAGSTTVTVKMKAGATAKIKVTVKK